MTDEFTTFEMERYMSLHEQDVDYNLSESGVEPVRMGELLGEELQELRDLSLGYPHVDGIPELKERIASFYEGASPDNVLVTVGAAEANFLATTTLAGPGDGVAVMLPNYLQIWGIATNHGADVATFRLQEDDAWKLDVDDLRAAVGPNTRVVAVCNPNNPTGHILGSSEMEAVVEAAGRSGAWILADEVYAGSERLSDTETPSFYGTYERVVAVGSLSKAYGLPGLRIGWVVAPASIIPEIWKRHEYVAISATKLGNHLAAHALASEVRTPLIARTRRLIREGWPRLEGWIGTHAGVLDATPPAASAVALVRYQLPLGSLELTEVLRTSKGVLIVPGAHFGVENHVRISFGLPADYLMAGLDRFSELVKELQATPAPAPGP